MYLNEEERDALIHLLESQKNTLRIAEADPLAVKAVLIYDRILEKLQNIKMLDNKLLA